MKGGLKDKLLAFGQQAAAAAAQGAKAAAKLASQEVLGAQCLLDYQLGQQVASSGPLGLWKIYLARSKKEGSLHPVVSAWVLDKRALTQTEELYGGGHHGSLARPSQRRLEAFIEQCRRDVQALARLKHPGVPRLVAPLEETRTQLVFITEPIFASLTDLLGGPACSLPPAAAAERRELRLSELEIKHGLLQVADTLHFLHSEAGLVHKGLCPSTILITQSGSWKLAGFGFSSPLDYAAAPGQSVYDYSDSDPTLLQQATQPPLPYVAPELVASGSAGVTGAADVFSLGCITFELSARRQLLPVGHSLADYESRVHSLTLVDMSGVPMGLEQPLRQMVAPVAAARPPAAAFPGCAFFQSDVLLRALKFLDTLIQREPMQKAAFLRDLPTMCAQFDARVLRYKVLPPLLGELRDTQLQPTLLPIILTIVKDQPPGEFADATLPALKPLLTSASGETLLLLVQNAELLAKAMPPAAAAEVLPTLLVRAAQHGDVRAQEEMLRKVQAMADTIDYEGLKKNVLPAVHTLCLGTTSAAVRVGSFACMSRLVARMDQAEAETMLATAVKVTAVDKSAPTTMCVLALGNSLAAH
ncbi:SCY1 2 [Chlorella sorokiniana]|uniref:SCY1 2 n=1 Tax=Chlorella sorokiniana TaxID=3076 RepID=A0A2P6U568_CHLSO|nr:SCY1 2 [Chlorella sorokiniana]|eukprot:PRW61454.1 SCY1 2 [Chlorella sorokiniana]